MSHPIKQNHKTALEDFGRNVQWLGYEWTLFQQLCHSAETRQLLMRFLGQSVFLATTQPLIESMIVGCTRLTDTEGNKHQANMTCDQILTWVDHNWVQLNNKKTEADQLKDSASEASGCVAKLRRHRNKRIAHSDFAHASGASALEEAMISDFETSVNALNRFTGHASVFFGLPNVLSQYQFDGDAREFLRNLQWLANAIDASRMPDELRP